MHYVAMPMSIGYVVKEVKMKLYWEAPRPSAYGAELISVNNNLVVMVLLHV